MICAGPTSTRWFWARSSNCKHWKKSKKRRLVYFAVTTNRGLSYLLGRRNARQILLTSNSPLMYWVILISLKRRVSLALFAQGLHKCRQKSLDKTWANLLLVVALGHFCRLIPEILLRTPLGFLSEQVGPRKSITKSSRLTPSAKLEKVWSKWIMTSLRNYQTTKIQRAPDLEQRTLRDPQIQIIVQITTNRFNIRRHFLKSWRIQWNKLKLWTNNWRKGVSPESSAFWDSDSSERPSNSRKARWRKTRSRIRV